MLLWCVECSVLTILLVRLVIFYCHLYIRHDHHSSRRLWHSVVRVQYRKPFSLISSWFSNVSKTMVFAAVLTVNLFNGLNTNVWTGWVFFAIILGIVLVFVYTVLFLLCPTVSMAHYFLAADIQFHQPRLVSDRCLWQQPIPVRLCLFLVMSAPLRRHCASSQVSIPGMANWLCSR